LVTIEVCACRTCASVLAGIGIAPIGPWHVAEVFIDDVADYGRRRASTSRLEEGQPRDAGLLDRTRVPCSAGSWIPVAFVNNTLGGNGAPRGAPEVIYGDESSGAGEVLCVNPWKRKGRCRKREAARNQEESNGTASKRHLGDRCSLPVCWMIKTS
jgi:hypothetical protein